MVVGLDEESLLDFMATVEASGPDAMGDVERRTELFDIIAAEFTTDYGKVGPFTSIMNVAFNIMKSFNATI